MWTGTPDNLHPQNAHPETEERRKHGTLSLLAVSGTLAPIFVSRIFILNLCPNYVM